MGFEPTTPTLARLCSTPELRPHRVRREGHEPPRAALIAQAFPKCNRTIMPASRRDLMARLASLGIRTETREHAPVFTVAEAQRLRGEIPGAHTKNLFLKDEKGALYLIVCLENARIDLKAIPGVIGSRRLSFGKP